MSDQVTAPWNFSQVESINEYQRSGAMHPFTCPNEHDGERGERVLIANPAGLMCVDKIGTVDECPYRQTWVWDWMADGAWRTIGSSWGDEQ